jgi:hypothetical protein
MSTIILEGCRVSNQKIKSLGFEFKYPHLEETFENFYKKKAEFNQFRFFYEFKNCSNFSKSLAIIALFPIITIGLCNNLG